jgi:hypothetical protein
LISVRSTFTTCSAPAAFRHCSLTSIARSNCPTTLSGTSPLASISARRARRRQRGASGVQPSRGQQPPGREWRNSRASAGRSANRGSVTQRHLGGGRGARPETFSTFEHTRGGMLQGSRFECRPGSPGRTLWCLGAPTRTCCGVTQGVKLRGQRRQPCQPRGGARPGRRGWLKYVKARRARHSEAAKEADRPQPKAMWDGPSDLPLPTAAPGCPAGR